jgi:3-hydroxyisobutyrate dehydrogenase-like beta-hydroxyacid dehydrogenase
MALRLIERGRRLRVLDPKPERRTRLEDAGAVSTDAEGLAEASTICFAVPDDAAIRAVLDGGLRERLGTGQTVLVHSTVLPEAARDLEHIVHETGASFVEAPVSGGADRARRGDLAVLVGGAAEAVDRARPVLEDLAQQIFELGAVGAASATKLANQLVMFSALCGVHEALRLARHHGVEESAALAAFACGTADTWVGRNWGFFDDVARDYDSARVPVAERPWAKDLWEILAAARDADLSLPMAGLLSQTIAHTVESHAAAAQKGMNA